MTIRMMHPQSQVLLKLTDEDALGIWLTESLLKLGQSIPEGMHGVMRFPFSAVLN